MDSMPISFGLNARFVGANMNNRVQTMQKIYVPNTVQPEIKPKKLKLSR